MLDNQKIEMEEDLEDMEEEPQEDQLDFYFNWGKLQSALDEIPDVRQKILFLQTVLSNNPYLCYDGKCPIFQQVIELREDLKDLGFSYSSPEKIAISTLSKHDKNMKTKLLSELDYKCDMLLQEMMKIASVNKANMSKVKEFHKLRLELIDKLNKSNFPIPFKVGNEIQDFLSKMPGFPGYDTMSSDPSKEDKTKK